MVPDSLLKVKIVQAVVYLCSIPYVKNVYKCCSRAGALVMFLLALEFTSFSFILNKKKNVERGKRMSMLPLIYLPSV